MAIPLSQKITQLKKKREGEPIPTELLSVCEAQQKLIEGLLADTTDLYESVVRMERQVESLSRKTPGYRERS